MHRKEALDKIAWNELKKIGREEAIDIIYDFFNQPLKPSLQEQLNITLVAQYQSQHPPEEVNLGNPIYRPVLLDYMRRPFRGATNDYLIGYLRNMGIEVTSLEGYPPDWLLCPVCNYRTFEVRGDWADCPVCGWNSDPMQEKMPDDPIGGNGISLNQARANYQKMGAISQAKLQILDPEEKKKYPKG